VKVKKGQEKRKLKSRKEVKVEIPKDDERVCGGDDREGPPDGLGRFSV
jgi:hypothetical protein